MVIDKLRHKSGGVIDDVWYFGVLLALLLRCCTSLFPYSGAGNPPLYGDYEAQRHWMEITVNLPHQEWYRNTSKNDLLYWGLDYPPLTAYHSLLYGYMAKWINSSWVQLYFSRGHESYHHKIFMRSSVIFADMLVFFPAALLYWSTVNRPVKLRDKCVASTLTLLQPGLILIDHGHFQYNCVSLGLTLWGILLLSHGYDLLGAGAFTLALNYKQMELYHALPFFCYLLGRCVQNKWLPGLRKFASLSLVFALTTVICWWPFMTDVDSARAVIKRLFPFNRGLYEDKVANIWCASSILFKWKSIFSVSTLALISLASTFIAILPSSLHLLRKPCLPVFQIALVNSSLIFFLLSFQVHEKSILLALLPVCLLLDEYPLPATWFIILSTFSMFPLLLKDGLVVPYFALASLFFIGIFKAYDGMGLDWNEFNRKTILFSLSVGGCIVLSIAPLTFDAPKKYPDLFAVLNALYSCFHFTGFALYFHLLQLSMPAEHMTKLKTR